MLLPGQLTVPSHIASQPRQDLTLIPVTRCQEASFLKNRERTAILGVFLSVRHVSMSEGVNKVITTGAGRYGAASGNSRARLPGNTTRAYDRIITFGDVSTLDGRCFAVILKTQTLSAQFFLPSIQSLEGVGEIFLLEEPEAISTSLGSTGSVPVLDNCFRTIPLAVPYSDSIPSIQLTSPPLGATKYFCQHNQNNIAMSMAAHTVASCGGQFCDRQVIFTNPLQRCGCFHFDREKALVIDMDVTVSVPLTFDQDGSKTISHFRSWKTSQLFVKPEAWALLRANDMEQVQQVREAVHAVLDHVNAHGGWTYVGWLRTGMVQDSSDTSIGNLPENLARVTQQPHLSYLYPTNTACVAEDNEAFQSCRLSVPTPTTPSGGAGDA
jgi:hypothetical protein